MSDADQPDREEDMILAGEYALGLLSADEAAAFEARLSREPELRAHYATWAEDFARLAEEAPPETPPSNVLVEIRTRLFGQERPPSLLARIGWPRIAVGLGAVAVLAAVVFVNSNVFDPGPVRPLDPGFVAQVEAEDGSLVVSAAYDTVSGALFVDRQTGAAPPGRDLELWLIAGEDPPVSLGVLPDASRAELPVPDDLREKLQDSVLAISDEPEGGSPTGQPTGDVLATGPITNT